MSTEKFTLFYVLRGFRDGNHDVPETYLVDGWYWKNDENLLVDDFAYSNRFEAYKAAKEEMGPWCIVLPLDIDEDWKDLDDEATPADDYSDHNLVTMERVSKGVYRMKLEGSYETVDLTLSATSRGSALKTFRAVLDNAEH